MSLVIKRPGGLTKRLLKIFTEEKGSELRHLCNQSKMKIEIFKNILIKEKEKTRSETQPFL